MKKPTVYKKIDGFKKAVEKCPEAKLTYVDYLQYYVLPLEYWKVFELFGIKPKSTHPEWHRRQKGYCSIVGYRVSLEVESIVKANEQMLKDISKYL